MKRYTLADLIKRWEREEMTAEQTIGQILLWMAFLSERVTKLEARQRKRQQPKTS